MHDFLVPDMYKKGIMIPTMGGFAILGGILVSLTAAIFAVHDVALLLLFYFIVIIYGLFGILDDLVNVGRILKIFAPFIMAVPIALINQDTTIWLGGVELNIGLLYSFIIAPLFVMVTTNLVNMHSGYNGLQSGLSLIMIIFLIIYAILHEQTKTLIFIMPLFGALLAFFFYNRYPSVIFEGNCGSLAIGAGIGSYIVLLGNEIFGVILLGPHIMNFFMYIYWRLRNYPIEKFGSVRSDETISVPNYLTLKWIPPYFFRLTERKSTHIMYLLSFISGICALVVSG